MRISLFPFSRHYQMDIKNFANSILWPFQPSFLTYLITFKRLTRDSRSNNRNGWLPEKKVARSRGNDRQRWRRRRKVCSECFSFIRVGLSNKGWRFSFTRSIDESSSGWCRHSTISSPPLRVEFVPGRRPLHGVRISDRDGLQFVAMSDPKWRLERCASAHWKDNWIKYWNLLSNFINSLNLVHNFVYVDAVGVGLGLVVAVTASVEKDFRFFVLLRVQHVVAFLKKYFVY